jgi:hypothetical protein
MRLALLCVAALLAAPAIAADEVVASNGSDTVRLSNTQCSSEKVLEQTDPVLRAQLRDATAVIQGESLKACWIVDGRVAHLLYEDGDQGIIPLTQFRKAG